MTPARPLRAFALALCAGLTLAPSARSVTPETEAAKARAEHIRAHYTKYEHRVPMRDGVRLFTSVYVPNDRSRAYPMLMLRTPYSVGPYGADRYKGRLGPTDAFETSGFIFVFQDVRGRFMSEGDFSNMRPHIPNKRGPTQVDESSDTYDTLTWLLRHVDGHNGKVGMRGISYPGFYAAAGAIDGHPALRAVSPQAPIADWFWDDMHHHGAFILPLSFSFFHSFGQVRDGLTVEWPDRFEHPTGDGYRFFLDLGPLSNIEALHYQGKVPFWADIVAHPNYDAFWQSRNILPHLRGIKAATLIVGGWYDTEDLYGPLKTYAAIEAHNPRAQNQLVMGPWRHGGWSRDPGDTLGDSEFGFRTSDTYAEGVELAFFEHHLKGGPRPDLPEAMMFETGANRWRRFGAWPPKTSTPVDLYLDAGGTIARQEPASAGADRFVSDPAKPVPYTMQLVARWSKSFMAEDQRFASWRPDVLVYRSEPLEEDLTLAGPIEADLVVSTDQTAADWVVKVIDEHAGKRAGDEQPDDRAGQHTLVRGEVMRGRFRESYEHPKPFVPGEPTRVTFELNDVLHTFKRGHRVMIHVQSSWFPYVDRNPQRYVPNIFEAKAEDYVAATHTVHRGPAHPSRLRVRTLPAAGAGR